MLLFEFGTLLLKIIKNLYLFLTEPIVNKALLCLHALKLIQVILSLLALVLDVVDNLPVIFLRHRVLSDEQLLLLGVDIIHIGLLAFSKGVLVRESGDDLLNRVDLIVQRLLITR